MKPYLKEACEEELQNMFKQLSPGEFLRADQIILSNPRIMQAFYVYDYTLSNHKTIPYLRRLVKSVTKNPEKGCGHISSLRIPFRVGRKTKRYWAWGYPDTDQSKVVLMQFDAISGGVIRSQKDKANNLGEEPILSKTQQALEEAVEEAEEKAQGLVCLPSANDGTPKSCVSSVERY